MMNMNSYEWSPTFLAFNADPTETARSTSWHVYDVRSWPSTLHCPLPLDADRSSQLFAHSHMTTTLPTTSETPFGPLYYVAGFDNARNSHIFKAAVYNSTAAVPVSLSFKGVKEGTEAQLTMLTAPDPYAMNAVGGANLVKTEVSTLKADGRGTFKFNLPNLSVAVLSTAA